MTLGPRQGEYFTLRIGYDGNKQTRADNRASTTTTTTTTTNKITTKAKANDKRQRSYCKCAYIKAEVCLLFIISIIIIVIKASFTQHTGFRAGLRVVPVRGSDGDRK